MDTQPITFPHIGARVWAIDGLHEHGPAGGPKVDVPPDTGGIITHAEQPYPTIDMLLYVVKWDSGQVTKHYFKELVVLGPFTTFDEFRDAVLHGSSAHLVIGPQGGFREFSMTVEKNGAPLQVRFVREQRDCWEYVLRPIIEAAGISIETERLEAKPHLRARKPKRLA